MVAILAAACSGPLEESGERAILPERPDQEAWDVRKTVTEAGRRKALIEAGHMNRFDRTRTALYDEGVVVTFYDEAGKAAVSTLTSRSARIDESERLFTAIDSVVLMAFDSTRLETDTLRWSEAGDVVTGGGPVVIRRREGVERGIGFEASSDLRTWVLHDVTTRLSPAASDSSSP